ncbi:acylneuraminate cytidylyltransferase family protein [Flavobacteriaceae bacterium]|nr:acylneuraminate cytidylyltransferase family protein [Flavobacteriaceae bacterium]
MKVLTVIPARSGSKSLVDKNIKVLNGKPLLVYSIKYSLNSSYVDKTIVSTDSKVYADIAKKNGADIPFIRPQNLSLDNVQDFPVIDHALRESEIFYNCIFDYVILLRPTSPFRPPNLIEKGLNILELNPTASSVRSVTKSDEHPYRQWVNDGVYIKGFTQDIDEPYNIPRQFLPNVYFQTGDIEIIRRSTIKNGSISGEKVLPLIIDHNQMLDIDSEKDWNQAQSFKK